MRARPLSENPGQASARENLLRNPDSLAPELLQLLTSEFLKFLGQPDRTGADASGNGHEAL